MFQQSVSKPICYQIRTDARLTPIARVCCASADTETRHVLSEASTGEGLIPVRLRSWRGVDRNRNRCWDQCFALSGSLQ